MSKTILLYSEDNKYKCVVELADSLDRFNCPDHSVLVLFEEREKGTYIIAQARDKKLETEKDDEINYLKMHLSELKQELALTEKALELMTKSEWADGRVAMKFLDTKVQVNSQVEYLEYFKTKAKEMVKSE